MTGESCWYRSRGDCLSGVSMRVASCRRRAVTFRRLREDLDDSLGPSTPWPCAWMGRSVACGYHQDSQWRDTWHYRDWWLSWSSIAANISLTESCSKRASRKCNTGFWKTGLRGSIPWNISGRRWCAVQDLNLWPLPCRGSALPTELTAQFTSCRHHDNSGSGFQALFFCLARLRWMDGHL